jgi:hypothetical protein
VIVLSDSGWHKLFGGDPTVPGRRVAIDGADYEVVGVMPPEFRGLGLTPPDYWVPLSLASVLQHAREDDVPVEVIGRLKPNLAPETAAGALAAWASRRIEFTDRTAGHQLHVRLIPRRGTLSPDDLSTQLAFAPLFFAFGLILMIGCVNVANLLLARGVARQREIAVRLALGASRRRIIRQLLTENLLLALIAAAMALLVARACLDGILAAAVGTIPSDFLEFVSLLNLTAPAADWRVQTFLMQERCCRPRCSGLRRRSRRRDSTSSERCVAS